jgi:hypothetical protein
VVPDDAAELGRSSVDPFALHWSTTMINDTSSRLLAIAFTLTAVACGGDDSAGDDGAPQCTAGELACVCLPGAACADGLACIDQQCHAPAELGLAVTSASARSCEVLLRRDTSQIVGATFGAAATGAHVQKGDYSALAFHATGDQPIPDFTMRLQVAQATGGDTSDIEIVFSRCFDKAGVELAAGLVHLRH